jgi:hypothetical protein
VVAHPAIATVMNWTVLPVMAQDQCERFEVFTEVKTPHSLVGG